MKKLHVFYFFLCILYIDTGNYGICQVHDTPINNYKSIPPTPNVASLGKFTEVPVSLYTGIPNISIPIYNIELKDFVFPVSLNYHSSGVKVDEIASNVGLGWSLQAGGSVYASVNGKPDFDSDGYLSPQAAIPYDRPLEPAYDPSLAGNEDYYLCMRATGALYAQDPPWILRENFDTQPDMFYYNFTGRSGKFFYTQDRIPHTVPYQPIIISTDNGNYTIIDEDGNRYLFDKKEIVTTGFYEHNRPINHLTNYNPSTTIFYLTKITTRYGEEIMLNYVPVNYSYKNISSYTRYATMPYQYGCDNILDTYTEVTTMVEGYVVSQITSSRGHQIDFTYSDCERLDLPGSHALKKIDVNIPGMEKEFNLSYGYFNFSGSDECSVPTNPSDFDKLRYRLKLQSVTESGKPPYVVNYIEDLPIPHRQSNSQDHWGYNTGSGGSTLLPREPEHGFYNGISREPNPVNSKAGIIKSMTYPTGGYSTFEFEPNEYYSQGGEMSTQIKTYSIYASDFTTDGEKSVNFIVPSPSVVGTSMKVQYKTPPPPQVESPQIIITLRNLSNTYHRSFSGTSPSGGEMINLPADAYILTLQKIGEFDEGYVKIFWTESIWTNNERNKIAGGLRIKQIKNYPVFGSNHPIIKRFEYTRSPQDSISSGKILYKPKYTYELDAYKFYLDNDRRYKESTCMYKVQTSNSILPLNNINGSSVAYTSVNVYSDSMGVQGLTRHKFSFIEDFKPFAEFPSTPVTSYDWQRGFPLEKTVYRYNSANNQYYPVSRTLNEYEINYTGHNNSMYTVPQKDNESHALGLNIVLLTNEILVPVGSTFYVEPAQFTIEAFKYISTWPYLKKTEEYLYDGNDTLQYLKSSIFYNYSNPAHAQLTSKTEQLSDGTLRVTSNTYPKDYLSTNATEMGRAISSMKARNILSDIIESTLVVNNKVTSGRVNSFAKIDYLILSDSVFTLDLTQPVNEEEFEPLTIFQDGTLSKASQYSCNTSIRYDSYGNIIQYNTRDGFPVALVWGYNYRYPVAEVKNALHEQVFYTGFENHPQAIEASARTGERCWLGEYTVMRPALESNYIISFWKRNISSNQWIYEEQPLDALQLNIGGNDIYIDDVRVYPKNAEMITYTYKSLIGLTSKTDVNNLTLRYQYDLYGRLEKVFDGKWVLLNSYEYNYYKSGTD